MNAALRHRLAESRMGFLILTRIPVGTITGTVPTMAQSAWSWPLVGLAVGAVSAAVWLAALALGLPPFSAATVSILAGTLATGALHEDGLADLADGIFGGRDPAGRLAIMRDSRIGSYGALALGFSLILRIGALATLAGGTGAWVLIGLAAASRAGLPMALRRMPAARSDGLGNAACGVSGSVAGVALALGFVALLPLGPGAALAVGAVMAALAFALGCLALSRIGGQTGDVLGAMSQLSEMGGWLVAAALLRPH